MGWGGARWGEILSRLQTSFLTARTQEFKVIKHSPAQDSSSVSLNLENHLRMCKIMDPSKLTSINGAMLPTKKP